MNQENSEPSREAQPANDHDEYTHQEVPDRASETDLLPPNTNHNYKCKKHRDWHDCTTLVVQIVGVVGLIAYTTFAALQLCSMNKTYTQIERQTSLLSAQLKGTEASFVNVVAEVGNQVGNFDRPFNQVYLIVQNSGHAIATNVRVHISIQIVSMTEKPMSAAHIFDFSTPALDFKSGASGEERRFLWDNDAHAAKTLEAIKALKMTARKEWYFEYGNGFGDTIRSETFCQELLINDWVSCQNFPIKLRSLNESRVPMSRF